jgi:hypothetical protein
MAKKKSVLAPAHKAVNTKKKTAPARRGTIEQRESIRFQPDPNTIAQIDCIHLTKESPFAPLMLALVTEESHRGCGLVLKMTKDLQVGAICRVKVGHNPALRAEVRWRVELDSQIIRIGVMLLE